MQIQKEEIKSKILNTARTEFFKKGFKEASMRNISKGAGVSTSNIYNYYKDKNELFDAVLRPVMGKFAQLEREHNDPKYLDIATLDSVEHKKFHIELYIELITLYRNELKLLLFHSYGSKYENFREDFAEKQTAIGREYLKLMSKKYPDINTDISDFFMHTFSSWMLGIIGELVFHEVSDDSVRDILNSYFTFSTGGWHKLLKV